MKMMFSAVAAGALLLATACGPSADSEIDVDAPQAGEVQVDNMSTAEEVENTVAEQRRVDDVTGYIDPVCGMEIEPYAQYVHEHEGVNYGFCSASCQERLEGNPQEYLASLEE